MIKRFNTLSKEWIIEILFNIIYPKVFSRRDFKWERNLKIVKSCIEGEERIDIAKEHQISTTRVRQIFMRFKNKSLNRLAFYKTASL